jgi:hypothetical protein
MKRHVLLYGLIGGILIAALKWAEYRFLVIEHSIEMAMTFIEPFPVGLVITFISAAFLRKKAPSQPAVAV